MFLSNWIYLLGTFSAEFYTPEFMNLTRINTHTKRQTNKKTDEQKDRRTKRQTNKETV